MVENGIGARSLRKEDQRFITGKGRYTDDIDQHGQTYAVFVRSPHAHAKLVGIDKASALGMPGVLAVLDGDRRRRRRARQPDLRLGRQVEGRLRHEDGAAPASGAGQGPLCR